MSGVAGADRVKSRLDFKQFLSSYQHLLGQFPGFVSMTPSGSYNSNPDKQDFGDIDLIVHIQSDKDKATLKKELQAFFMKQPETVIVPFSSAKHTGKRTYNAGELVSVRYHDDALGYSAQIDNIVALDHLEASFKQAFLDMPAEEQGLVLGLVKIATIETEPAILFQKLGINVPTQLEPDQEYEFNLSGVELQLRKVTYEPGTFKQLSRDIVWNSKNFDDLQKLLYQYDLKAGFESLLQQAKQNIRNPRSNARMQGVFSSMISVKSGEVGTPKGAGKEAALAKVQQAFGESKRKTLFRSLMESNSRKVVFAFGRFQPPTIGHELLINTVKQTATQQGLDYVIYVSKKQDTKTNPLDIGTKMAFLQKMFPGTNFVAADATVRTPLEAIKQLNQQYNELIWVAGSDRVPAFTKLSNDYNGKDYQYQHLEVLSSGERDPDSEGTEGVSGTKMREEALANNFEGFRQGLPAILTDEDAMKLMNLVRAGLTKAKKLKEEAGSQLNVQQLASISDEALDNAYHYGRSTPGNSFGWQANLKSAAYAKQMIDSGVTDIEKISDAIHKGWNVTAQAFVQNPDQFDDTAKLKAAGKLEAKLQQRAQLMKQNYAQLPDDEKEKDRVVARALLQAIRGTQDTEEGYIPTNTYSGPSDSSTSRGMDYSRGLPEPSMLDRAFKTVGKGVANTYYKHEYNKAVEALKNAKTKEEHDAAFKRARSIQGHVSQFGIKFEPDYKTVGQQGVAEGASKAMANTAIRLTNKDDGKVTKLRAAGDKKREDQLKGRDIAKRDSTSKDDWGNLKEAVDPESDVYLESVIAELSSEKLGQYKKAAGAQASAADKAGDTKKADKRFSGIVKATKKQFANDSNGVAEAVGPGQYAKLYHSTPEMHLDGILKSGYLAPTGSPAYLSLTRDSRLDYGGWGGEFVEFDIDQNAVRQRIKLEPYNHSATMGGPRAQGGGESEERTKQKIPLKGFVTAMHAPTGWEGDKAGEYYGGLLKKYGIPIIYDIVPKLEEQGVNEKMLPNKIFAGTKVGQKVGKAAHWDQSKHRPAKAGDLVGGMEEAKKKGADGKACWDGYRYNGTENGSDKCVKVGEDIEKIMESFINKIIVNEAIQNNKR